VGQNLADLIGCFQLSNPITVNRVSDDDCPDGLGSTEEATIISDLCIFPNPVEENNISITVNGINGEAPSTIEVIDQNGQLVITLTLTVLDGAPTVLQLPDLQAGSYFLRLTNGGTVITERFTSF
ncbi:MAG: T9SS type A sorting domain-containing protein, partial [Bacteroidota bacterium]